MNTMITNFRFSLPLMCALFALSTPAWGDRIFTARGLREGKANITKATTKEVEYKLQGVRVAQKINAEEVTNIEFTSLSATVRNGIGNIETGDYAGAVRSLRSGSSLQDPSGHVAGYYLGVALLRWGGVEPAKLGEAITAFESFIKKYESDRNWTWFVPFALEKLGQAQIKKGDFSKAEATFSKLSKFSKARWGVIADLSKAEVLLAQDKYKDARSLVGRLTQGNHPTQLAARVWIAYAQCQLGEKQYQQAIKTLDKEVIGKLRGDRSFGHARARAYILWGDCEAAAAGSDKDKLSWAKVRYLRAITTAGHEGDDLAEALYKALDVCKKLGQSEQAAKLRTRLTTECGNSPWAKK